MTYADALELLPEILRPIHPVDVDAELWGSMAPADQVEYLETSAKSHEEQAERHQQKRNSADVRHGTLARERAIKGRLNTAEENSRAAALIYRAWAAEISPGENGEDDEPE